MLVISEERWRKPFVMEPLMAIYDINYTPYLYLPVNQLESLSTVCRGNEMGLLPKVSLLSVFGLTHDSLG